MFERIRKARWDCLELVRLALRNCPSPAPTVCEIGVSAGEFAELCLKTFPEVKYVGIDPWEFTQSYRRSLPNKKFRVLLSRPGVLEAYYKKAKQRIVFAGDRAKLLWMRSDKAVAEFADDSFILVRVDGDHSYANTLADIEAYWPKVAPGGILCGDDFHPVYTTTVCKAVTDWFAGHGMEFSLLGKQTWWVSKPNKGAS